MQMSVGICKLIPINRYAGMSQICWKWLWRPLEHLNKAAFEHYKRTDISAKFIVQSWIDVIELVKIIRLSLAVFSIELTRKAMMISWYNYLLRQHWSLIGNRRENLS